MEQIQWIIGSDNLPSVHRENNLQSLKKMDLHEFNGQTRLLGEHLNEKMYAENILNISRIGNNNIGKVSILLDHHQLNLICTANVKPCKRKSDFAHHLYMLIDVIFRQSSLTFLNLTLYRMYTCSTIYNSWMRYH